VPVLRKDRELTGRKEHAHRCNGMKRERYTGLAATGRREGIAATLKV
jgi:hypothetical protein